MDQELTLEAVQKHIAAPEIIRLLALWIKMGAMDSRGRWVDPVSGVAQGSVISPLLSNVYLTPFDDYLTQKGHALVRYADNFILLASNAEGATQALEDAKAFLQQRLKLQLNADPQPLASLESGFVFLGIYFRSHLRRIADKKVQQMQGGIRRLWQRYAHEDVPRLVEKLNESILGWKHYYGVVQPVEQFRMLDGFIAEGLARALALRLTSGALPRQAALPGLLGGLEFLHDVTESGKKEALGHIVRRARALRTGKPAEQHPETVPAVPAAAEASPSPVASTVSNVAPEEQESAPGDQAAPDTAPSAQPEPAVASPRPVEQVVRQQKRRYIRQAVQGSELVISEPGVFLGKTSRRVVVKKQGRVLMEMPLKQLRHVIIASPGVTLSSAVIALCAHERVPIDFLTPRGEPLARLYTPLDALGHTGLQQLQAVHDGSGLKLAQIFVYGKLKNQLNLVKYYHKYRKRVDEDFAHAFREVEQKFASLIANLRRFVPAGEYDTVRHQLFAFEGQGGNLYWQMIRLLLEDDVEFVGRERQGATDLVNSLLNYGYGMLYPRVHHALMLAGLHPGISFLHSFQDGKPTLTFDLIEEFRSQAVDRVVFGMITKGERLALDAKTGHLTRETVHKLIQNVLERLAIPVRYRSQEKSLQEIILLQAKLLAAHLHGKARYRPYIGRW